MQTPGNRDKALRSALAAVLLLTLGASPALAQPYLDPNEPLAGEPAPTAAPAPAPMPAAPGYWDVSYARFNRLAFSIGFGFGGAELDDLHTLARMTGAETTSLQINAELSVRYYVPYYGLFQVGYSTLYNANTVRVDHHNLVMEIPILFGGYYPFLGRLCAYGGIGPSVFFYRRSFLDPGPDFKTDGGVGLQLMFGGEIFLSEHFAIATELRYRSLPAGIMKEKNTGLALSVPLQMDMSGASWGIQLRFFAM